MEPNPSIALVVIARNEARCIERCLLSAKKFVDRMLVLDTGSTDDTIAIATTCGAEVHQAAWTGDFSAARNKALALADADWNLVLDADEWLEAGGESLHVARNSVPSLGIVLVKSDDESTGQKLHNISWIPRLLPRGVQYRGRIHEQPKSALPRVRLPLILGHDGYSRPELAKKLGRNRSLLLRELELNPNDPYIVYQLGKDHEVYDELSVAADFYLRALELTGKEAGYRHELCIRLMYCLGKSGRIDQAIALAADQIDDWSASPDYFFALGNLLLDKAIESPEEALEQWLPNAQAAWIRCLDIGERPELEGTVHGRGSFLAAHNLAALCEGTGDKESAKQYQLLSKQLREAAHPTHHEPKTDGQA